MADPKNYTGIFPSTYGGSFITQDLISPLLQPFLRREEIRPEEIQPVEGSEAIRINLRTGMPEAIRDIEVVPGEYGPIESGGGIQGLLEAGVLNFLKAKNFLSTPEGREQVATVAQEMPSQLVQAGEDYVLQQVDMANRGLQEVYDPETNTIVDFTFPQTVAETMLGTATAQPAIQLQRGEFIAPMVQKVKGGAQIPTVLSGDDYIVEYLKTMRATGDPSRPFDLATGKFSAEDNQVILNKIEKYFRDDAGTPSDPIRAMILRGDLEIKPQQALEDINLDDNFQSYLRNTPAIPPSVISGIQQQADLANEIIVLQNQLRKLNETRGPDNMGLPHEGYRNVEDLAQARSLQNQIAKLNEKDTALTRQTTDRQFFDKEYDEAMPFQGAVIIDEPGKIKRDFYSTEMEELKTRKKREVRKNIEDELAQRKMQYEQMAQKFDPTQPFQGFANQAELERYRDLALGPRFPEEAAPFTGLYADFRSPSIDYLRQDPSFTPEYDDFFQPGGSMERAMYEQEILYSPLAKMDRLKDQGLGFLHPEIFIENLQLLDPKKVKNMSFPQMVKAGVKAQNDLLIEIFKGDRPEQLTAALKKNPKLVAKIKPQILLEGKGLETMMKNETGTIVRLLRPEETELEGFLMKHSVGGYNNEVISPNYNENFMFNIPGGKSSFLKGEKRVYSLRDPQTGLPRATIDLAFDAENNIPLDVQQVKALANGENFSVEDRDLIVSFLKQIGVKADTNIGEGNDMGKYLQDFFDELRYAEGGIVSLANGGAVEHGIVTL